MRIVYLHQYFNTPRHAGSTRSFEMARLLVERGHEVHMIASWREPCEHRRWMRTEEDGIQVHWLPVRYDNRMSPAARIRAFLSFAIRASVRASRIPADVVFASSTPLTIALPGLIASRLRSVPLVFEVRDLWPEVPIALDILRNPALIRASRWLESLAYRKSARVVALAPGMADHVRSHGTEPHRIEIIPNGCDVDLFACGSGARLRATHDWLGDRPLVLYAGTLGLVHDAGYLVEMARHVHELAPEIAFAILGDGAERSVIEARARALGILDRNVFFAGTRPKQEIADWFAASSITLSTIANRSFLWENAVTNKFFDSLAAGRPIACNHPGWQTSIALEHDIGVMLDPEDPAAGADALIAAISDEEWIRSAGQRARCVAEGEFSRRTLAARFEDVLSDAIAGY